MDASHLLERVRSALAPRYRVERELGRGGMAVVYLAHDTKLECRVAIKVLPPELATENVTSRFVQEAQILASLRHSHIVPVRDVGDADGLSYYVMDYIEGPTLETRLRSGPLNRNEAVKLGRDLLDAVEAVHDADTVHRDVKPGNIFLQGRRAMLADFGIARKELGSSDKLTGPGAVIGTPAYMAPEQSTGLPASARSDLYSVGMVLYEALTGRAWCSGESPSQANWSGVPLTLVPILSKALALAPEQRWQDAAAFRRRLWGTRIVRYRIRTALLTAAGIMVGVFLGVIFLTPEVPSKPITIRLAGVDVMGSLTPQFGDSLTDQLHLLFDGPDIAVCGSSDACGDATLRLRGEANVRGNFLVIELEAVDRTGFTFIDSGSTYEWKSTAENIVARALLALWGSDSPLGDQIPHEIIPRSSRGLLAWLRAERLFDRGRWSNALDAYHDAVEFDSTCIVCSWRITEVERWHSIPPNEHHVARAMDNLHHFPTFLQILIVSRSLALEERLDTLRAVTERWPNFEPGWFQLGTELFHRGPLARRHRSEAVEVLQRAIVLREDFSPSWQLLAWAAIAEGRQELADSALRVLDELAGSDPPDPLALNFRLLLEIGFGYRFGDEARVEAVLSLLASDPRFANDLSVPAAPRMLPAFGSPEGAIRMGTVFSERSGPLAVSGRAARAFGMMALGRPTAALEELRQLNNVPGFDVLAPKLEAALWIVDREAATEQNPLTIGRRLEQLLDPDVTSQRDRIGVAWMLSLLGQHVDWDAYADSYYASGLNLQFPLTRLLEANLLGMTGDYEGALRISDTLRIWEPATILRESGGLMTEELNVPDEFFRVILHLLRSEWQVEVDNALAAAALLRWHEHSDQAQLPIGRPTPQELDWSFGTLAVWRLASVLGALPSGRAEECDAYRLVTERWEKGDSIFAARADTAAARYVQRACSAA